MPFVIDLDPVALDLGVLQVRWYGLLLVLAIAAAWGVSTREAARLGIPRPLVSDAALWVGIAALAGGRALYVLQHPDPDLAAHPAHILMIWMGGLSFYGGLAAGLGALVLFARRRAIPVLAALDVAAPAAALGQAIGHVGCLVGGDSWGIPADVPWAVVYRNPAAMAPLGIPLHPTQAYEAVALLAVFAVLWRVRHRLSPAAPGLLAAVYLSALAVIRFGLFFLRDEPPVLLGLRTAQWIGLGILAAALVLMVLVVRRRLGAAPERAVTGTG